MAHLNSNAERFAERATKLPAFRNLNLGGVKDEVAEILNLIGRVDGVFSTYTKHDISHIDAMLRMLDWLVPPQTQHVMSPVDWLLLVLGIYFHDLGMVVSSKEYQERLNNPEFVSFLERLNRDPDSKDYLARSESMSEDERSRFFYQEFVREHHAARIREWIHGRQSRFWGNTLNAFNETIEKIMSVLPSRFRENLGTVCESHHKDNLNDSGTYPLAQRYGNDPAEIANVQYASLLLRTVDLIHVTKDRTPSIMYKAINFSDLKSIDEWDKQIGTFSVHMKGREFDPKDTESHVIQVDADFTEERPFFALTEYLAYADAQIKQTKQWADTSQQTQDARDFCFPWREIKGDVRVEGNLPRQMRFELDRGRLLNLLVGHTIYNEPTVAIRELLQNAIDALRFQFYLDKKSAHTLGMSEPAMGRVLVKWNPDQRELVIEDNGIGMDLAIVENHLLRVGSSFYASPQFQSENADFTPISRFGIGILTCFMISDNIEIVTFRAGMGRRIRMTSVQADYLLKDLMPGDVLLEGIEPHGTRVRLKVRPSVDTKSKPILDIVKQWVLIPQCEVIYVEGGVEQKVGFETAAQALEHLFGESSATDAEPIGFEIVTVQPEANDGAHYELAFVVKRSYFPERSFVNYSDKRAAAVCIEGIRADWRLPGFRPDLCGLLSVRNNKKFRTTVSRESLETDDEYNRVATLCAGSLFRHVEAEVERIAASEGQPLLQASSAGRWVYESLKRNASQADVVKHLDEMFSQLPLVVIETVQEGSDEDERKLKSLDDVKLLECFWTVESRAVDYLGVISRDLGREVNITKFLATLAPELYDPRVNLILEDPHAFLRQIRNSHVPVEANFSRKHQRTLLKWEPHGSSFDLQSMLRSVRLAEFEQIARNIGLGEFVARRHQHILVQANSWFGSLVTASITGDIEGVTGVKTRLLALVTPDSSLGNVWTTLKDVLGRPNSGLSSSEVAHVYLAMIVLSEATSERRARYGRWGENDAAGPWRAIEPHITAIFKKLELKTLVPSNLEKLMGNDDQWFSAAWFWRNWGGGLDE